MIRSAPASAGRPARGLRGWLVASVLAPLLMFGAAAWYDHQAVLGRAQDALVATTHALAEHGKAVMQTAALAIDLELNQIQDMDWQQIGSSAAVHQFLVGITKQLPQVQSAFFVDPSGFNSASSRSFPMKPYDDRARDYYRLAAQGQTGLLISAPFHGKAAGTLGFVVSRARLTDGRFDGIAAVTLSPRYFADFYQSVLRWHTDASAALLRTDGTVLVRYPSDRRLAYMLSPQLPIMRDLASNANDGVGEGRSMVDGRAQIFAWRRLPGTGLVVCYSLDRQGVLTEWYQHLVIFAAFALLACATLLLAGRHAAREAERRRRAEAALHQAARLEALGRLTGGVAHDFNNLLAAVLGSLELALRRVQDARVMRQLSVAQQAAQRGARLTAQMLAFARKQAIEPQPIDANVLIGDTDELLRRACGTMVRVRYELQDGLWHALADPVQLELALLNLAANARDAMPDGGEVTLRTRNAPFGTATPTELAAGDHVLIEFADTGPGMAEDVRRSAFEPFFTTKGPGKGTGLGLSMVYGFTRQLGGTATIDSVLGRGTTVRLYLPRSEVPAAADHEALADARKGHRLSVLLVDDDAAVRASAREMLVELGYSVTEANGGEAALVLLETGRFDLLLADFAMPGMNGSELAEAVKRLVPELPIVFMTGFAQHDALRIWTVQGYRTVEKPFDLAVLDDTIRRALRAATAA
ncbi:MAG TPA: response regulator [Acetobacteraceae bacterium]|nr:response regulator [Acetobacteraceae bacterium]